MESPRLWMNHVSKRFVAGVSACRAEVRVLDRVSLVAHAGEVVTVVGGRGAGKTTLIQCAAGLLLPDDGEVRWDGGLTPPSSGLRLLSGHDPRLNARLALRAITHGPPRLLLVDGAADEMDACDLEEFAHRVGGLAAEGATVLVTTRRPAVARRLDARCVRLERGVAGAEEFAATRDPAVPRVAEHRVPVR